MDRFCEIDGCERLAHARGMCASHYSTWHRGENGRNRKTFARVCVVCGAEFSSFTVDARYCSTGPRSCEAAAKSRLHRRLRNTPLFNLHRGPTSSEVKAYRRVLRRDPCAYCGSHGGALDHLVPKSACPGDDDGWRNLTGSCHRCNGIKHVQPLLVALLWIPVATRYHDMRRQLYRVA